MQPDNDRWWGLSEPRPRALAVVVGGLHLEDVGDDAVDLNVPNEAGKEQLLCDGGADQPEGRETQQQLGQPGRETRGLKKCIDHNAAVFT